MTPRTTDVLIIGAGLCGLRLAIGLANAAVDVHLVDGRDRVGGRILTRTGLDLGPAWFWPGQPRIAALIRSFGLRVFDQYAMGDQMYEDDCGQVQRARGWASMEGSHRLAGGLGALVQRMAADLPQGSLSLNTPVAALTFAGDHITAVTAQGPIRANRVVLALPPRLAAGLAFDPPLPPATIPALQHIPTWMAGQAKAVAVYARPFWRDAGLSGDATSRRGPMAEIHDASNDDENPAPAALFGFIGTPPAMRQDEPALRQAVITQLTRLFGQQAANPRALLIKDWAADPLTATALDQAPLPAHPQYSLPAALRGLWGGRLHLSGTETAPRFGGYLEGALEAAEITLQALQSPATAQASQ